MLEPVADQQGTGERFAFTMPSGVREELLAKGRKDTLRRVVQVVGDHLDPRCERLWRLPALLQSSARPDWGPVTSATLPWVEVEKAVLQALSNECLAPAHELELLITEYLGTAMTVPGAGRAKHHPKQEKGTAMSEQTTRATVNQRGRTAPTVWGNIPPRNPNFTGREALLDSLHARLLQGKATAVLPHALHGMGGVGKSLLAVEYLYRRLGEYDVVWWIPAERTTQISLSLVELAPRLGLQPGSDSSSTVTAVLEALRRGEPYANWLLVFDNAESPEAVRAFFPSGGPGNILITSRNPQWASIAHPLEVDVFRREESKQLLRIRGPEISDADADRLAEALGDLPLAIEQAAAWHAETGMLADEYLRLLDEKRVDLLSVSAPLDYQMPVIAAWNISLDQLESKNPAALQLLQVCSFCAPDPISRSLFARMQGRPIAPELDAALADPIRLGQVIREIGRYSLARFDHRTNSIQMHRLVQTALLSRMTEEERIRMRQGTHLLLAANDPNDPTNVTRWSRYGELYPHVLVSEAVQSGDPWVRNLVINEVRYLMYWGDYEPGRAMAQTAYDLWSQELGADHPRTLEVARWLGFLLFSMGRYTEAASLNAVVVEAYRRSFGEDHQDTVDATGNVAIDRRVQGEFSAALELSRSVHQRYLRLLGPDEPETLRAAHNLGVSLRLTGDFNGAQNLDRETWHSWTQIYGQDHVDSLRTWLGLILDIRELGDYGAALTYHREIVEQARSLLGPENPLTLSAVRHLAVALRKAGEHNEAREVAELARGSLIRRYGEHNPESMAATLELTVHLRHPEQTDSAQRTPEELSESRSLGEQILDEYAATYGTDHPHTLSAAVNLAITHRLLGHPETARDINDRVLSKFRDCLGEDHPASLVCRTNLASDFFSLGDFAQAEALDQDTLRRTSRVFDAGHPSTLACAVNLSMDLRALGQQDAASILHDETVNRLRDRLGSEHPAVAQAVAGDHRADCDIDPMPL
ncbi:MULTISPECIES: FxSxx-COOH system tetratricopeptide repeat protein [Streptacidiphilus]|uniref:FxSxx-COOH system tetratricopeptide repeat protein n=1 Tax=Streptacidiphilus cavernicola TaxID=3342716 RepID=A0ABV6UFM3_9ACTN|nr:FxSxx-COOH system tetratricopeptide repeat protein [Streptacidiphilus jeojiense]